MPSVEFEENKTKDELFAKIALKNKMATQEQIESCLTVQKKKDTSGSYIPLYKVLIAKNVLDQEAAKAILKEIKTKDSKKIEKDPESSSSKMASSEKKKIDPLKKEKSESKKPEASETKKVDKKVETLPEGNMRIGREWMTNYKIKFNCSCGKSQALSHKFLGKTGTCTACKKQIPVPHPDDKTVLCLVCDCGKDFNKDSAGCTFCGLRKPPTPPGGGQVDLMKQLDTAVKEEKKAKAAGKQVKPLLEVKTKAKADRFVKHTEEKPKQNPILVYLKIFVPVFLLLVGALLYYYFTSAQPVSTKQDPSVLTPEQLEINAAAAAKGAVTVTKEQKTVIRETVLKTEEFQKETFVDEAAKCYPSNLTRLDQLIEESGKGGKKNPHLGDMHRFRLAILLKQYGTEPTSTLLEKKMNSVEKKGLYQARLKKIEKILACLEDCQNAYRLLPDGEAPRYKIPANADIPDNNVSREYKDKRDIHRDLGYIGDFLGQKKAECLERIAEEERPIDFGEN